MQGKFHLPYILSYFSKFEESNHATTDWEKFTLFSSLDLTLSLSILFCSLLTCILVKLLGGNKKSLFQHQSSSPKL